MYIVIAKGHTATFTNLKDYNTYMTSNTLITTCRCYVGDDLYIFAI